MRKIIIFVVLLALLSACGFAAAKPAAGSYITPEIARELMPVSQIKRGMKGYGLTVFHGTKIEKFGFEVRGILKEANSGGDLILVKLSHPLIDSRHSGVIQGMSGSPCYINGKLVGAVAYGYGFDKENTCMLTPIHDMLEALDPALNEKPADRAVPKGTSRNKLRLPISCTGLSESTRSLFSDAFEEMGFAPAAGGTGKVSEADAAGATLQPGAAVGVVLVSGDITLSGTGTVTWRKGNTLLAFGHPMEGIGPTELPMCKAYVVDVFSSYDVSRKYSVPLDIVGTVYQDRPYAIAGEINRVAGMTPVNAHVKDISTGREKTLRCKVAAGEYFFGSLAALPVVEAYARVRPQQSDLSCRAEYKLELAEGGSYSFTNYYTAETDISLQLAQELTKILTRLSSSKYGYQKVKSIDVDMQLESGNKYAYIERVFMDKKELKAGDDVEIGLVMRPYGSKDTFTETRMLHVPDNLEDGNLTVLIYGGILADAIKIAPTTKQQNSNLLSLFDSNDNSTSFEQYFRKAMDFEKNNELVIKIIPAAGDVLVVEGNRLDDMPPYMNQLFTSSNNSVFAAEKLDFKTTFVCDSYIPMGAVAMQVPLKNHTSVSTKDIQGKPLAIKIIAPNRPEQLFARDGSGIIALAGELEEALETVSKEIAGETREAEAKPDEGKKPEDAKAPAAPKEEKKEDRKAVTTVSKRPITLEISGSELERGEFTSCSMGKDGAILPTVEQLSHEAVPEQMATCGLQTDEGLYIGTGLEAAVYLHKPGMKPRKITGLDGLWVTRLLKTSGGLFAATAPDGKIFRINGQKAELCTKCGHKYISDMTELADGRIMVGFADSPELLVFADSSFDGRETLKHDGVYTTDFASDGDRVIIGTKKQLLEYKDGKITVLNHDLGGSVNCVAVSPEGDIYAYVAGKNIIVKQNGLGLVKIAEKTGDMIRATADGTGNVYFAGKSSLVRVFPDGRYAADEFRGSTVQFADIALTDEDKAVLCSVNPGAVYEVRLHPSECRYSTPLIDLGAPASLQGVSAPLSGIEWYSENAGTEQLQPVKNTPFTAGRLTAVFPEAAEGSFTSLKLSYFMPNRPPEIKLKNLTEGQKLMGKYKLEWEASDPDSDMLICGIMAKEAGTEEWVLLYPNEKEYPKVDAGPVTSYELDTSELSDGKWEIMAYAIDTLSNPTDEKGAAAPIVGVLVCNSEPVIVAETEEIDGSLFVKGIASCAAPAEIVGVQYSADDCMWVSCKPEGDFFRGTEALFAAEVIPMGPDEVKKLRIRAIDSFGNHSDFEIKLEEAAAETEKAPDENKEAGDEKKEEKAG